MTYVLANSLELSLNRLEENQIDNNIKSTHADNDNAYSTQCNIKTYLFYFASTKIPWTFVHLEPFLGT